ncbi:MAG: dTDP-4-dehydrorhamnose 3,5-epimerase family protein [Candidatus Binataceae bacterium]
MSRDTTRPSSRPPACPGFDLSAENHRTLYVPEGFAHGYLTLADHTEVSECYNPGNWRASSSRRRSW